MTPNAVSSLTYQHFKPIHRAPNNIPDLQQTKIISMRGVTVKKGEQVDRALKRLKTKLDTEGILEEMRRRRAFESPTDRKIRKLRTASKRNKVRWRFSMGATAADGETVDLTNG